MNRDELKEAVSELEEKLEDLKFLVNEENDEDELIYSKPKVKILRNMKKRLPKVEILEETGSAADFWHESATRYRTERSNLQLFNESTGSMVLGEVYENNGERVMTSYVSLYREEVPVLITLLQKVLKDIE